MLGNQKIWGSIISQGVPFLCCPVLIYTSFYTEITRENTNSKHGRYTRNVANRISSLNRFITQVFASLSSCFGC